MLFVGYGDAGILEQLGCDAASGNERAGKRAIVDFMHTARWASRFQDGLPAAALARCVQCGARPCSKCVGAIESCTIDYATVGLYF